MAAIFCFAVSALTAATSFANVAGEARERGGQLGVEHAHAIDLRLRGPPVERVDVAVEHADLFAQLLLARDPFAPLRRRQRGALPLERVGQRLEALAQRVLRRHGAAAVSRLLPRVDERVDEVRQPLDHAVERQRGLPLQPRGPRR